MDEKLAAINEGLQRVLKILDPQVCNTVIIMLAMFIEASISKLQSSYCHCHGDKDFLSYWPFSSFECCGFSKIHPPSV